MLLSLNVIFILLFPLIHRYSQESLLFASPPCIVRLSLKTWFMRDHLHLCKPLRGNWGVSEWTGLGSVSGCLHSNYSYSEVFLAPLWQTWERHAWTRRTRPEFSLIQTHKHSSRKQETMFQSYSLITLSACLQRQQIKCAVCKSSHIC